MSTTTLHPVPPLPVRCSEAAFVDKIITVAHWYSWVVNHQRPAWTAKGWRTATQGDIGYPDLVLASTDDPTDPLLLFLECKSEQGQVTKEQAVWIRALETLSALPDMNDCIQVKVVRPRDFPWIVQVLSRGRAEVVA